MKDFLLDGHAKSLLPKEKDWKLVWHDEFDGTELDHSKWNFRLNFWGKRFPAFADHGVELDGHSCARLHLLRNPDGSYCSPHLQTGSLTYDIPRDTQGFWPFGKLEQPTFLHTFGYYEIRCRLPKCDGWHSAFWLQAPGVGSHPDPRVAGVECDVMENYRLYKENLMVGGNIWGGYGKDCKGSGHFRWQHVETPDRWHTYGVDWAPDGYAFYVDGKLLGRIVPPGSHQFPLHRSEPYPTTGDVLEGPVSHAPQFLLVSTECHSYRSNGQADPLLDQATLPDYFEVDHVRVFDDVSLARTAPAHANADTADASADRPVFMF